MAKQIAKGFTMVMLLVGIAFVTAAATNAQTNRISAEVPFDFTVGDKNLPAGKYVVSPATSSGDGVMIRATNSKAAAVRLTNGIQGKSNKMEPRLVFHRYGQSYFLAQVWTGNSTGHQLLRSKKEKALQRELGAIASKTDFANGSYEIVVVAGSR